MATKTIYKKITLDQANTRTYVQLTPAKKAKVNAVLVNFFQYLKDAHS